MQDRLFEDPDLVRFYDAENGWGDDTRYCLALAGQAASVLDLGCGTGLLAAALGPGRQVWGVDPAGAMLDVARARPGGSAVTWVEADGRSVRLGRRFDLVVMTGHAFQCLLTDADQRALCDTIAAHLAPQGRFVFDSRTPAREEWREWTPELTERSFDHPALGRITAWNDVSMDFATGIVTYQTCYRDQSGNIQNATSRIRFASRNDIAQRIAEAGLQVDQWLGDWSGNPWTETSPEIIPIGRLA
ncbi:SAM-dependent methyltransferase [Aestuariivirga litoralis]|uniref:SAM-dependent methyltransferase n=1 Tax=Aestuariivirga litoralis TaxID=2650924 RepID=A0A2W2AWT0_9HYPH|nr:class I SAM-dependent methyltransferase [Aestuariivirga litoralis]PZF77100.1 SAM-dependent methyltransferase [Aestuariivirga litoralis]